MTNTERRERQTRARGGRSRTRPTRISWTWVMLIVAVVLGIALVDFLVQNTHLVRIEFFSVSGRVPTAVALLAAALAGAAVVLVVGASRIGQLRHSMRLSDHGKRNQSGSKSDAHHDGDGAAAR